MAAHEAEALSNDSLSARALRLHAAAEELQCSLDAAHALLQGPTALPLPPPSVSSADILSYARFMARVRSVRVASHASWR